MFHSRRTNGLILVPEIIRTVPFLPLFPFLRRTRAKSFIAVIRPVAFLTGQDKRRELLQPDECGFFSFWLGGRFSLSFWEGIRTISVVSPRQRWYEVIPPRSSGQRVRVISESFWSTVGLIATTWIVPPSPSEYPLFFGDLVQAVAKVL